MKSKENLVFLGMMGSGKTSIGLIVSKKLKLDFIDIDNEIEKEEGMKISKIFDTKGEGYFRDVEETIALKHLKKDKCIISLGGGAFLNKKIHKEVLNNHVSFWLNLDAKTLIKRIRNSTKRPIASKATTNQLIELIKKRSNIYSKALYEIDCKNLKKSEIVDKILNLYEAY